MAISLGVKIWGDIKPLLTELKKSERELKKFGKNAERIGKELSTSLSLPIAGFGVLAVKNFADAEKATASLTAQLRANGKDVDATLAKYTRFAEEMQRLTTEEDDAVKGFLQLAESMQSPDAEKATKDAIGLSKAFGVEMPQAIKMAVQAQNGQFTMLSRLNPAIRAAKTNAEKAAIAQKMFADGFQIATEQAKVGLGPLEQLKNQIGNLTESYGKIITEALIPIVEKIKGFAAWLDSLSESQRKWIVGISLAVAAIGPLILVIGKISTVLSITIGGIGKFITVMRAVPAVLATNPWLALAGAIAAVGVAAWAAGRYLSGIRDDNKFAEQNKKETDQATKDIQDYVSADANGRKQIIDNLRVQAQSYVDLYNKSKQVGDTKAMEHYSLQVAKINVLVDDMKEAVKSVPNIDLGGDVEEKKGLITRLNDEISKLEIRLQSEVAANSKNAQSTANLIAEKKRHVEAIKAEVDRLTGAKNIVSQLSDEVSKLENQLQDEIATQSANAKSTSDLIAHKKGYIEAIKEEVKLLSELNKIGPRKTEDIQVGISVKEDGNIAESLQKHSLSAQKLREELVRLEKQINSEIDSNSTNYETIGNLTQKRDETTESLKREQAAISKLLSFAKEAINIPVKVDQPKLEKIKPDSVTVPVGFDKEELKIDQPDPLKVKVEPIKVPDIKVDTPEINIPVTYDQEKLNIPKPDPINVDVNYNQSKISQQKIDPVKVPVDYQKGEIPKAEIPKVSVPVEFELPEIESQTELIDLINQLDELQKAYDKTVEEQGATSESALKLGTDINTLIGKVQKLKEALKFKPVEIGIKSTVENPAIQPVPNTPNPPETSTDLGAMTAVEGLEEMGKALDSISDKTGSLFASLKNAFSGIVKFAKQAAEGFRDGWKSAVEVILGVISNVVSAISEVLSANIQQRMSDNDEYYEREKENIENSYMTQDQKTRALERLDKGYEKKRKALMREQAKDAKATAIMQAVVQGALAVVTALAAGPIIGEVLAVVVGALAAAQIALIAAQPLPALAEGGLASAPTMAVVGDNPNAMIDPEVISPLSKLKTFMKGTQEVVVYGVLKGTDIILSSERSGLKLARVR